MVLKLIKACTVESKTTNNVQFSTVHDILFIQAFFFDGLVQISVYVT